MNLLISILEYFQENLILTIILAVVLVLIIAIVIAMIVLSSQHKKQMKAQQATATEEQPVLWEIEEADPNETYEESEPYVEQKVIPLPAALLEEPAEEKKEPAPAAVESEEAEEDEEEEEGDTLSFEGTIFDIPETEEEPKEETKPQTNRKPAAKKTAAVKTEETIIVTEKPEQKKEDTAVKTKTAKAAPATKAKETEKKPATAKKAEPAKKTEPKKAAAKPATEKAPAKTAAKPAAKTAPAKTAAKPAAKAAPAKKTETEKSDPYSGKWVIKVNKKGSYYFALYASNGEKMLTSGDYATAASAKSGIETYKKNIESGRFNLVQTKKSKDYIFQLLNANGKLMAIGADYKTRERCEDAIESTKRFAKTARIEDKTKK